MEIKLPNSPAFGFETFKNHALTARVEMWETRAIRIFGICLHHRDAKDASEFVGAIIGVGGIVAFAISKILGYLPVTGAVVGLRRIQDIAFWAIADGVAEACVNDGKTTLQNKSWHLIRGLGEAAGCGIIWLPIDLVVTLLRSQWQDQEDVTKHAWLVL